MGADGCSRMRCLPQKGTHHQIDAYLQLVAALGLIVERLPMLAPTIRAEMQAQHLWAAQGWGREDLVIGICPGAAFVRRAGGPSGLPRWRIG